MAKCWMTVDMVR